MASVLYRDTSWFNVLLYHGEGNRGVQSVATIDISERANFGADTADRPSVHNTVHPTKNATFESTVSLTDLDHLIELKNADSHLLRLTTGTPMFIAVECASPKHTNFNVGFQTTDLQEALKEIEKDEKGVTAFDAAFPDSDADFLIKLEHVLQEEVPKRKLARLGKVTRNQGIFTHQSHHDLESVFWLFTWTFARTQPLDPACTDVTDVLGTFNGFCKDMLQHIVNDRSAEAPRASWLYFHRIDMLLHPDLAVFENVFNSMAQYLSIPWHLYGPDKIDETHAFVAFRRLILNALIHGDPKDLDIPLNTEEPRVATALDEYLQKKNMTTQARLTTANEQPSTLATQVLNAGDSSAGAATASHPTLTPTVVPPPAASTSSGRLPRKAKRKFELIRNDDAKQQKKKHWVSQLCPTLR